MSLSENQAASTSSGGPAPKLKLGRKGQATRQAIMDATRRLLDEMSPIKLTAASIAKEAGTAPATFYVYFNSIEDVLTEMCRGLFVDTAELFDNDQRFRSLDKIEEDSALFVKNYMDMWRDHCPLLVYRNMEAQSGNKELLDISLKIAEPVLQTLTQRMVALAPADTPLDPTEAYSDVMVIMSALDRIASAAILFHGKPEFAINLAAANTRAIVRAFRR